MDPKQWMNTRWPNCKAVDENWTFARYDYPEIVCQYIRDNWIKVSEEGGGTYNEPTYHRKTFPHLYEKENPSETKDEKENAPKEGQEFAQAYKETKFYEGMDDANKKAVNVMAEEGMEAAVKHMFTDEKSGRQLSYAEMRMRFG